MPSIQLQGKIFIRGEIETTTGLHIGGSAGELDIGGVDNPVIRNPLTREPYIPGSSLRGKMRSLLDRHLDRPLNKPIRRNPHRFASTSAISRLTTRSVQFVKSLVLHRVVTWKTQCPHA